MTTVFYGKIEFWDAVKQSAEAIYFQNRLLYETAVRENYARGVPITAKQVFFSTLCQELHELEEKANLPYDRQLTEWSGDAEQLFRLKPGITDAQMVARLNAFTGRGTCERMRQAAGMEHEMPVSFAPQWDEELER